VIRLFEQHGTEVPDLLGINCGAGPATVFDCLLRMRATIDRAGLAGGVLGYSCLPNAGQPSLMGGRYKFMSGPEYCASYVEPFVRAGARIIGGCCGTTPEHIKAMRQNLDNYLGMIKSSSTATLTELPSLASISLPKKDKVTDIAGGEEEAHDKEPQEKEPPKAKKEEKPSLAQRLRDIKDGKVHNGFFVSVELDPPKGAVTRKLIKSADMLYSSGADSINVGDSPMARVRMSSLATCQLIGQMVGIETIIHFTTRDRNLMGIQADLLGCQALGIHNILALTGDPPGLGNYAHATAVYDVDSIGLIKIITQLNEGKDISGNTIGTPTNLSIGCALNCTHEDRKNEIERFKKKLDAGAHFVMTQPIYQVNDLTDFLDEYGECDRPILVGIMPLHSSKHAEYLHNEVPGITIPKKIRQAMAKAGDQGAQVGLELAQALLEQVRTICQGTYLVPSFGRYEDMCTLVERLKRKLVSSK
jgi:methionine synthase / methylenetetrahydrofolate reductase(NADPH)